MSTGFSKDSKNPYRTGVLVGNHTEDRFGQEISAKPVSQMMINHCLTSLFIEANLTYPNRVTGKI